MAELDHTAVSIRFAGKNLDPNSLGERLRFIDSEITKSTIMTLKSGVVAWSVKFAYLDTMSLDKKIEALLTKFTKDMSAWNLGTENLKADIFYGLFLDEWNQGFSLPAKLMKELSDRNLEIGFDVYSPTDSWE